MKSDSCGNDGTQKYPGLSSTEWYSKDSVDIYDLNGEIVGQTQELPQFNGQYWAGTECSNLAQRSIVAGKVAPGVDLQMEVLSPYLTSQAFCEIPETEGQAVEDTPYCYSISLDPKGKKKINERKLRRGDVIVYNRHISIMYSHEASCKKGKCLYMIIHAYGGNNESKYIYPDISEAGENREKKVFGRKVMPTYNNIGEPTHFGRIKLWN